MDQLWREEWKPDRILHTRAEVLEKDSNYVLLRSRCKGHVFRLVALAEDPLFHPGMELSLFGFKIVEHDGILYVERLKETRLVPLVGPPRFDRFVELCSGLGALSIGTSHCGIKPWAAADHSSLAVSVYNMNHEHPATLGDIMDCGVLADLLEQIGGQMGGIGAGFPCPPFSQRGDQLGFADPRSNVFVQCLNAIYLFGAPFAILECTSQTGRWAEVNDMISSLTSLLSMTWCSGLLRLHRTWPCYRTRWWAILAPKEALPFLQQIPDLPIHQGLQRVCDVIPRWPVWPQHEERGLDWLSFEMEQYAELIDPQDMLLPLSGTCPTILHSCGHHFFPCPCGCRQGRLSQHRLIKDGVSVVALRSETGVAEFRHLHPQEAGFLCTLPPNFRYKMTDPRISLPLIGQLAAPIQAHWIALCLQKALYLAEVLQSDSPLDCEGAHLDFLKHLLCLRHHAWPTREFSAFRVMRLRYEGATIEINIEPFAQVKHLLHAQKQLIGWGTRVSLFWQGMQLDLDFFLHEDEYTIGVSAPRNLKTTPQGDATLTVRFFDDCLHATLPVGSFVADFLQKLGIPFQQGIILKHSALRWGDRIWHDQFDEIIGRGLDDSLPGLNSQTVSDEASSLAGQSSDIHLVPVEWLNELLLKPKVVVAHQLKRYLEKQLAERVPFKIALLYCWDQHWALCVYDILHETVRHFDGLPNRMGSMPRFFTEVFADFFHNKPAFYPDHSLILQQDDDLCGTIALINFGFVLGLWVSFDYSDAWTWHQSLQQNAQIYGKGAHDHATALAWLVQFLPSRGVPESKATERAALAIKKLGLAAILKAIAHERPWQQLKALGNGASRPFQWVTYDELQTHIAARAGQQHGATQKRPKKKGPLRETPISPIVKIDPDQLSLQSGTFINSKKDPIPQISADAVRLDSTGIAIVSLELAQRFLFDSKKLSNDPLALLTTVVVPTPVPGTLIVETLTWPALLGEEPLLIKGSLIQLGEDRVSLRTAKQEATVMDTILVRIQVYRDQWPHPWDLFVNGPLKQIIRNFPAFQLCSDPSCGGNCGYFHPSVEETCDVVILDRFAWRWFTEDGASTSPAKAVSFAVMIRMPESAADGLIKLSGKDGLYVEVRDAQDGSPSKWIVIWVKSGFEDAQHCIATLPHTAHIARLYKKYGIVCLRKHEDVIRQLLFPGKPFIQCDVKILCHVGPWPYGVVKQTVQDFLTGIPWKARAMKPVQGGPDGRFWLIGAEELPKQLVHPFGDHQITIVKQKEAIANKPTANVVASLRTMHRLQGSAAASSGLATPVDPLIANDPWSAYKKRDQPVPTSTQASASTATRLEEIETKLLQAVDSKMKEHTAASALQTPMDIDEVDRMNKMQADINELRAQSQTHQQYFHETGERMQVLHQTVVDQGIAIEALNHTVGNQVQNTTHLQNAFHTLEHEVRESRTQHSQDLAAMTDRIEAMLAKKLKTTYE